MSDAAKRQTARSGADPATIPNDPLGAFCRDNHVALEGAAAGPLAGLTFGAKDLFHVAGQRTGFGHPDWLRSHPPATATAVAIRQLLDAGAGMLGKTLTDELAYSLTGENSHYGTPINPAAPDRVPGGSSNGSASAVAGGLVDFGLGSDCGGSVRLPASYCGILGMRPSHGRVSLEGAVPFAASFDVAGWFARDPAIFERVGRVLLADEAPAPEPRRLLIALDAFRLVEDRVTAALSGAIARAAALIGRQEEIIVSPEGLPAWFETFRTVQAAEIWANHGAWIEAERPRFGRGIRERLDWASKLEPEAVETAKREHKAIRLRIEEVLEPGDILCLPSSPRVAPLRNTPTDDVEVRFRHHAMCLLCISGLGGLPQVSLPLAELDGLPLGFSLVGPQGSDTQLLALARALMA